MDQVIKESGERARAALEQLGERAKQEGWDVDRVEREKWAVALSHDVTICSTPGCLGIATEVPGFRDLVLCKRCEQARRDGNTSTAL